MNVVKTIVASDFASLGRSPVRVVSLLLIVAVGLFMGTSNVVGSFEAAYETDAPLQANTLFRGAGLVAGFLACGWSAAAIINDRDAHRLEMVITSGCSKGKYLLAKLMSPILIVVIPGIVLVLVAVTSAMFVGDHNAVSLCLLTFVGMYVPTIICASCFGACLGTLLRNRSLAVALFMVIWILGLLPVVSFAQLYGTTLATLDGTLSSPLSVNAFIVGGATPSGEQVPGDVYADGQEMARGVSLWSNIVPLGVMSLVTFGLLARWLSRRWKGDASKLISDTRESLHMPMPQQMLDIRVMRTGKLLVSAFAVLGLGALVLVTDTVEWLSIDPRMLGIFLIESMTPLCFAMAYAGLFATDVKKGTYETNYYLSGMKKAYVRRVIITTFVLMGALLYQAWYFQEALAMDIPSLFLMGLAPTLFFGGIAYVLGILTGSESSAASFTVILWVFLCLPFVSEAFLSSGISWLYPVTASFGSGDEVTPLGRIPVLAIGLALFVTGQLLLGRLERFIVLRGDD